jgi:predicted HTH transcriptional regulator
MFQLYIQHFKAWLRGDTTKIVSVFQKALTQLDEQEKYLTTIADNQAHAARDLAARSKVLYDKAMEARTIHRNIATLVNTTEAK